MERNDSANTTAYDVGRQLAMAASFLGGLLVLGHLAGQIRDGSAPLWTLLTGAALFLSGMIVALLFSICARLKRIEHLLSTSSSTNSEPPERQPPADSEEVSPRE